MTDDITTQIAELRKKREELINGYRADQNQPPTDFDYYPIDPDWRIEGQVKIRKPKPAMVDYQLKFVKVGVIKLEIKGQPSRFALYEVENEPGNNYIFIKDGTSGKSTYGLGRFVRVIKEGDKYFVDFNLACTPACGFVEGAGCPFTMESTSVEIEAGEKAPVDH
ncbi:MAG: DUF1684 domain-containing protein [Candidatus Hodarchaeales archaeon]